MFETRILVKNQKPITNKGVLYSNAEKFAKEIQINPELRYNAVLSGNFIFGDFIEALILEHVRVDYQTDSTAKKETTNYMIEVNLSKQR